MTTERRAASLVAAACALALAHAAADGGQVSVHNRGDDSLPLSAHTSIPVVVELAPPSAAGHPLLLTPHIEGNAIELVRGRLLRADAKPDDATHLRFELPVVARSEGTAILRVDLITYSCDPVCRRVSASESRVLHVR
jgi:hypothetical protein